MVEAGGRFVINDASGIGTTTGARRGRSSATACSRWATAPALRTRRGGERGASSTTGSSSMSRARSSGSRPDGPIVNPSQSVGGGPTARGRSSGLRTVTGTSPTRLDPSDLVGLGISRYVAGADPAFANGGGFTDDSRATGAHPRRRGRIILGDGAVFAGTTQTATSTCRRSSIVHAGATLTIGSTRRIDGRSQTRRRPARRARQQHRRDTDVQ